MISRYNEERDGGKGNEDPRRVWARGLEEGQILSLGNWASGEHPELEQLMFNSGLVAEWQLDANKQVRRFDDPYWRQANPLSPVFTVGQSLCMANLGYSIPMFEVDDDGRKALAEQAFQFEALLGNKGGRQDQWAASHGGWNHLMFMQDSVEEMPISPIPSATKWLRRQLVVVNSNISHVSGDLHNEIWRRYNDGDEEVKDGLMMIRLAARGMAKAIQQDRRDEVIRSLKEVCKGVDLLDKGLHEPFLGVIEPLIQSKEVLAWKALGAGGGGCAMLLCNLGKRESVEKVCEAAGWSIVEWEPDNDGLTITSS